MSSDIKQEELMKLMRADSVVDRIIPKDSRGKYLRPLAKRVSDNTDLSYQDALDLMYEACASALVYRLAGDME